jgi:MFS family permease
VLVLVTVVREDARPEPLRGGYRLVLRDRAFVHLAVTNVAIIAVGWAVLPWLVPPYAEDDLGVSARLIGLLMLANAATVVVAQVPIAKLGEGRRRVVMMAAGAGIFTGACLLVAFARLAPSTAYPLLVAAAVAIGVGECLHTTALMPLVADLAPASIRGRYMAAIGLSWWIALALVPTVGVHVLSRSTDAAFWGAGALAAAAAVSMLALERRLPEDVRLTPRTGSPAGATLRTARFLPRSSR